MKPELYLALPVLATVFNVFFVLLVNHVHHSSAQDAFPAQQIKDNFHIKAGCQGTGMLDDECLFDLNQYMATDEVMDDEVIPYQDLEEEEDPMLKPMPGVQGDFKAYVRADISSFYGEPPGSRMERKPKFLGQGAKLVNMSPDRVTMYWVDFQGRAQFTGNVGPWSAGGSSSFPGHSFIFTRPGQENEILCRFRIVPDVLVYYCDPFDETVDNDPARAIVHPQFFNNGVRPKLESLSPKARNMYDRHRYNLEFSKLYKNFTGGSDWLSMFPRDPPRHKIWRADYFGQIHTVQTVETQFVATPPASKLEPLSTIQMRRSNNTRAWAREKHLAEYRAPGLLNLTVKALSCAPRAFEIRHFLSDVEVEHILNVVSRKHLERSTTNGHLSATRTSRTTWINRSEDPILDSIFRRVADVLRMNEALLRDRMPDELPHLEFPNRINEDLQIVHYDVGQEYTAHHDFGYTTVDRPNTPTRSINLCMYLNNVTAGGQTAFPRWRNAETDEAIKVTPEKGKAMIFYMVNPDGNLDHLTQHAALPVIEGEKFFANLWIHDPYRL